MIGSGIILASGHMCVLYLCNVCHLRKELRCECDSSSSFLDSVFLYICFFNFSTLPYNHNLCIFLLHRWLTLFTPHLHVVLTSTCQFAFAVTMSFGFSLVSFFFFFFFLHSLGVIESTGVFPWSTACIFQFHQSRQLFMFYFTLFSLMRSYAFVGTTMVLKLVCR